MHKSDLGKPFEVRDVSYLVATAYDNLWATITKRFPNLSVEDKLAIVALVLGTCSGCHDDNQDCQCWNDE